MLALEVAVLRGGLPVLHRHIQRGKPDLSWRLLARQKFCVSLALAEQGIYKFRHPVVCGVEGRYVEAEVVTC